MVHVYHYRAEVLEFRGCDGGVKGEEGEEFEIVEEERFGEAEEGDGAIVARGVLGCCCGGGRFGEWRLWRVVI